MVDRSWSSRSENKRFSTTTKSRKSSSVSSEFDEEYREHLEGKYLGNGLEIRPPSGTNHQVCAQNSIVYTGLLLFKLNFKKYQAIIPISLLEAEV